MNKIVGYDYNTLGCANCGEEAPGKLQITRDYSGWAHWVGCKSCGSKHLYGVNDAQGCEGCPPYHLARIEGEWWEDYFVNLLILKLIEAERGWQNSGGGYSQDLNRILYTAKNLIKNLDITIK